MHLLLDNRISTQSTKVSSPVSVRAVFYTVIVRNVLFFFLFSLTEKSNKFRGHEEKLVPIRALCFCVFH